MKKILNKLNRTAIIAGFAGVVAVAFSFTVGGGDPVASNTRFVNGKTDGVTAKKEFNAGEEIYVCLPLKSPMSDGMIIRLEAEGQSPYAKDLIIYKNEKGLNYLSFALAIDPKNHYPEEYFYKEGQYAYTTKLLSQLTPGKYKITFGTAPGMAMDFRDKISLTVVVTAEGAQKWKQWAEELARMDKEYEEKLKKE